MTSSPTERDWEHLIRAIEHGSCVLVLGPDAVAAPYSAGVERSLSATFAAELLALPEMGAENEQPLRPLETGQRWLDRGGKRYELVDKAVDFYRRYDGVTSEMHQSLARLPFRVYLNTTQDHFLQQAFQQQGNRVPQISHYNFREVIDQRIALPMQDQPLVYNLYGDIDDSLSLVLTESDLLLFLESIVTGTPPLPPSVEGLLRNDDNAFLFLGFGFQQWHVRLLLHTLLGPERYSHQDRHRPSLVLERGGFYQHPDSARTMAFFRHQHSFEFRQLSAESFVEELVHRYSLLAPVAENKPPKGAPLVFLSYRHEDGEKVALLKQGLHRRGIATWQDADKLRGGERWKQALQQVIGKHCNYFLLCQTPSLMNAGRSVVFDEIDQALERAKEHNIDDPIRFLIPAILEPCVGLETLGDLHVADLTTEEGIDNVCREILAHWATRRGAV